MAECKMAECKMAKGRVSPDKGGPVTLQIDPDTGKSRPFSACLANQANKIFTTLTVELQTSKPGQICTA
jgi:hypothetical protein